MGTKKASYNLLNYVEDSHSDFNDEKFNEIDGLVLSQVANMKLGDSGIDIYSGKEKTFTEIWNEMNTKGTAANSAYKKMDDNNKELIELLAKSERFKDLSVSNFVENPVKTNVDSFSSVGEDAFMEQFAAVTITYEQDGVKYNYVSFRATDNSPEGWSEDLSMLYSLETQAQLDSKDYLNIVGKMTEGYITGGGHSKAGNDFEFGYLFCDPEIRARIVKGYVYDSPGIQEEIVSSNEFYDEYLKITNGSSICPQDSVIGQLLHENENNLFIYSVESGFNQHDPYSWEIDPTTKSFIYVEQSELSKYINEVLDKCVENMTIDEKKAFFSFVSYLLYEAGGMNELIDFFTKDWKDENGEINKEKLCEVIGVLYLKYQSMTEEEQKAFMGSLGSVVTSLKATTYEYGKKTIEQWIEDKITDIYTKVHNIIEDIQELNLELKEKYKEFLLNVYNAIENDFRKLESFLSKLKGNANNLAMLPYIEVDTNKLKVYAQRLNSVNNRIINLDRRLDSLYWKVGLKDLWSLMQADILTGYSWRLKRCANYLNDTAIDFNDVENKILKN